MRVTAVCVAALAVGLAGCEHPDAKPKGKTAPPRQRAVQKLEPQSVVVHKSYPTTLEGVQTVALRPRVSGYLDAIDVDEGAHVDEGQLLFRINADQLRQAVGSARANVAAAQARVETAKVNVAKQEPLVAKGIVSDIVLQTARHELDAAKAALAQARAELASARADLAYTRVVSPTRGVIGTIAYRVGSLVGPDSPQPLTMIADISQMRAYFPINEKDYLALSKSVLQPGKKPAVGLILADGSRYPHTGVIDAVSGLIDQSTGTVTVRATFDNPEELLRSGASGTIELPGTLDDVFLIPQAATYEVQNKRFAYVVGPDGKVAARAIETIPDDSGQQFIVTGGLKANETIVTEGLSSLSDGAVIEPMTPKPAAE